MNNKDPKLVTAIEQATRIAAKSLFSETGEKFYYFTLITSGEGHPPFISAWSKEKLDAVPEEQRKFVKWSYADSPYCEYGSEFFSMVNEAFDSRPDILELPDAERIREYELRLNSMEEAVSRLSESGAFGTGAERESIVVNVEVMPPDHSNTERALRLNPSSALADWLREAAE